MGLQSILDCRHIWEHGSWHCILHWHHRDQDKGLDIVDQYKLHYFDIQSLWDTQVCSWEHFLSFFVGNYIGIYPQWLLEGLSKVHKDLDHMDPLQLVLQLQIKITIKKGKQKNIYKLE